jgi:hypothetical protein
MFALRVVGAGAAQTEHLRCVLCVPQVLQQQARELQQQQQQQQQPDATISISSISSDSSSSSSSSRFDPQQLMACINAAATLSQLEAVCNTCLAHAAFSPRHAAAVLGRLHAVQCRPRDSPLLLVELLAQRLPAGCSGTPHAADVARAQQLTCSDVAWSCWVFARVGYSPGPVLLQQLLAQFWHCQSQGSGSSNGEALATLVAGLAGLGCRDASVWARIHAAVQAVLHQQQQRQQSQPQPQLPIASLQQLAWGFAAMQGAGNVATTAALARALRGRLQELMAAEDLATTVWCLHLLGCTDRELFEAAARQMLQRASAKAPAAGPRARGGQQAALQHNHQQQQQQQQWRQRPASPQRLLALAAGDTAARCTAAASSALGVLQQYDPLLCMLAVYRDHCQPATS